MRSSEFTRAVTDEFGDAQGRSLLASLALTPLASRTANEAIAAGEPYATVWRALCAEMDVPIDRRYGVGLSDPKAD